MDMPELPPATAWMDPGCPRHVMHDNDKRDFMTVNGAVGKMRAEPYTAPLFTADQLRSRDEMWAKRAREERAWTQRLATMALEVIDAGQHAPILMNVEGIKDLLRRGRDGLGAPTFAAAAIREEKNL